MRRFPAMLAIIACGLAAFASFPAYGSDVFEHLFGHSGPPTLTDIARMIDRIQESLVNQGTVVVKQPDVWSQARMSQFRQEYEDTMARQLTKFELRLAGRIARSDAASFSSQTALAASLTPQVAGNPQAFQLQDLAAQRAERGDAIAILNGTSNGTSLPAAPALPGSATFPANNPTSNFTLLNSITPTAGDKVNAVDIPLSLEPTVQLDQQDDYIKHLHRLRRINLGDDNADSAGYGLYLMRIPLSIQPGNKTKQGFGAIANLTVRHDFTPRFLQVTYRNLVINDLVDKLSPVVHELIRSGTARTYELEIEQVKSVKNDEPKRRQLIERYRRTIEQAASHQGNPGFVLNRSGTRMNAIAPSDLSRVFLVENLLQLAVETQQALRVYSGSEKELALQILLARLEAGGSRPAQSPTTVSALQEQVRGVRSQQHNNLVGETEVLAREVGRPPSGNERNSEQTTESGSRGQLTEALAREEILERNEEPERNRVRLLDVRSYLRSQLEAAYDIVDGHCKQDLPALQDVGFIERLVDEFYCRKFEGPNGVEPNSSDENNGFDSLYSMLMQRLPGNLHKRGLGALAWGIVLEAGLLNRQLHEDMKETKGANDYCAPPDVDGMAFYLPEPTPEVAEAFQAYVRARWPMITFALEPVVDQQNIDDAFTRRRDLQLAVAYALASGRISFRQAMTYTRNLQYEAQTIALNQTVAAFANGNDTFGWRIMPRYQTPPEESNFQALTNTLLRGGPGPNWQLAHAKIESGMRELTAVVVMPSFVQGVRVDVWSDWFRLHDPDERKLHTARTIEIGRRINDARDGLEAACKHGNYRREDVERLRVRLHQLETMLPIQTSFVRVPYENTLGGFALFSQGKSDLVPQLSGFEGPDYIDPNQPTDLILYGKHFSLYETSVVVGGKSLLREGSGTFVTSDSSGKAVTVASTTNPVRNQNGMLVLQTVNGTTPTTVEIPDPGTFLIQSREIMRLRIPKGVTPVTRSDGTKAIEVFVSTPTGISNRLQIPIQPETKAVAPTSAGAGPVTATIVDPSATIRYKAKLDGTGKLSRVGAPEVLDGTMLRILPSDTSSLDASAAVVFSFPLTTPKSTFMQDISIPGVPLSSENKCYVVTKPQLEELARQIEAMLKGTNQEPAPESTFQTQRVTIKQPGKSAMIATNQLTVKYEFYLTQTASAGPAPPASTALAPAAQRDNQVQQTSAGGVRIPPPIPPADLIGELPPLPVLAQASGSGNGGEAGAAAPPVDAVPPATLPTPVQVPTATALPTPAQAPTATALPSTPIGTSNPVSGPAAGSGTGATATVIPGQTATQTVVVVPRAPSVNLSVPISNYAKPPKRSVFHREPATPQNPARPSVFQRLFNGP